MTAPQRPIRVLHKPFSKSYNLLINHSIKCLKLNHMLITLSGHLIGFAVVFGSAAPLFADYTLILKNGRTITVKAYREEGGMIIFTSHGGKIRIAREEVESIIPAVERVETRRALPPVEGAPGVPAEAGLEEDKMARPGKEQAIEDKKEGPLATKEKVLTPEEIRAEERAKEEKEYQKKVREITERIKVIRARYAVAIKGNSDPENRLISLEEAAGLFADKGGKLSGLRKQTFRLTNERERLIQEMRQQNFDTASLFLE